MSLINDALRKAKQAPRAATATAPALRPAEVALERRGYQSSLLWLGLIGVGLLMGGVLVWIGVRPMQQATLVARTAPSASAEAPKPVQSAVLAPVPATPVPEAHPIPERASGVVTAVAPAETTIPNEEVVRQNTASPKIPDSPLIPVAPEPTITPPPPQVEWPKLQGIFYHPTRPSALLGGRTVALGGRVGEFRVLGIHPDHVTLTRGSLTNVLSLSE